jgi:hypothetical protein
MNRHAVRRSGPSGPSAHIDGRVRRQRRYPVRLLLESVLIVLSVLLAFGLNEWRMQRADRVLTTSVLQSFRHEIEANLELLSEFQPQHVRLADAITALPPESTGERTALAVVDEARPAGGTVIMLPAEAAWQTAVSTGALRLLDYRTAATISRIYLAQRDYVGQTALRLTDLVFDANMIDTATTTQSLHILAALLRELAAQELSLMGEYRAALAHLEGLGVEGQATQ